MTTDTATTTTTTTTTTTKPTVVPTAKVFVGYVDELMAAGAAVEKVAAKIALAATRQAAHRSSLSYLNAAYAAFKQCRLTCLPQLTRYALGVLGGMTADDKGNPMIARSKSILRVTDAQERKRIYAGGVKSSTHVASRHVGHYSNQSHQIVMSFSFVSNISLLFQQVFDGFDRDHASRAIVRHVLNIFNI